MREVYIKFNVYQRIFIEVNSGNGMNKEYNMLKATFIISGYVECDNNRQDKYITIISDNIYN